ncbi:succinate dehydrogenase cytochrome b subunit [Mariniluteicoccus flavus]
MVRKYAMAISGLILIGFLLIHMYGNLKLFSGRVTEAGPEQGQYAFDVYAHHLRVMGEPILPHEGALWITRVVLLAALLVHAWSAFTLWSSAKSAAGGAKRYTKVNSLQRSYASYTMRWGGVTILLFVIYHILHFTVPVIDTAPGAASPMVRVVESFKNPLVLISYLIAMVAVALHVRHGFWSAFATLGANTSAKSRSTWNLVAAVIAVLLFVGFVAGPIAIILGGITL